MKNLKTVHNLGLILSLLFLGSCSKNENFIYRENLKPNPWVSTDFNVKEIQGASGVDVVWVIDNSGSMSAPQRDVIQNAALFMEEFIKNQLSWKMGLLSTSTNEIPKLGFLAGDTFDSNSADPVTRFQDAVRRLGVSGDAFEKPFASFFKNLNNYPNFLRSDMPLAIIFVTDVEDQSNIDAQEFVSRLKTILGPNKQFYTYAILGADDLGCEPESSPFNYAGSEFEKVIQASKVGRAFPICDPQFGKNLAEMGKEISEQVLRSTIYLQDRPLFSTLSVTYQGEGLPGGDSRDGAVWYYDYGKNAIVFYTLGFAKNPTDSVMVNYKIDDGFSGGSL